MRRRGEDEIDKARRIEQRTHVVVHEQKEKSVVISSRGGYLSTELPVVGVGVSRGSLTKEEREGGCSSVGDPSSGVLVVVFQLGADPDKLEDGSVRILGLKDRKREKAD